MQLPRSVPLLALAAAVLTGCMNMPTPSTQITGAYTSSLKYETFECGRLGAELDSVTRRETQLVVAQEQRLKTSQMQAFWWGFGQGDGIEASELATVRGEKEALVKAMQVKACEIPKLVEPSAQVPPPPHRYGNPGSTACSQGTMRC